MFKSFSKFDAYYCTVTNCLRYPCDTCQTRSGCQWIELSNGKRLCASALIAIYGARNISECTPVAAEYLPAESRNQRGLIIRQSEAPNQYYSLIITFPIGMYFDTAPNNVSMNYTCAIQSGGVGWIEQSTTAQFMTVASTTSSLETIYSILNTPYIEKDIYLS